jgi:hypothetical protein
MAEKKTPDPWAVTETDEKKSEASADAWDATQWHEVKKNETLWKIDAMAKATALKAKAAEVLTTLKMPVPEALKA